MFPKAFLAAIEHEDKKLLTELVLKEPTLITTPKNFELALRLAASRKKIEIFQILISQPDVHYQLKFDLIEKILAGAICNDDLNAIKSCMSLKIIDEDYVDDDGNTFLMLAIKNKSVKVAKYFASLLNYPLEAENKKGESALSLALKNGMKPLVNILCHKEFRNYSPTFFIQPKERISIPAQIAPPLRSKSPV